MPSDPQKSGSNPIRASSVAEAKALWEQNHAPGQRWDDVVWEVVDVESTKNEPYWMRGDGHSGLDNEGKALWKIHLNLEPDINNPLTAEVAEWGKQHPLMRDLKVGHGGKSEFGTGLTLYVGNYDDMVKVAQDIDRQFSEKLPAATAHLGNGDIQVVGGVTARFDAQRDTYVNEQVAKHLGPKISDARFRDPQYFFSKYGMNSIPLMGNGETQAVVQGSFGLSISEDRKLAVREKNLKVVIDRYGEYFMGQEAFESYKAAEQAGKPFAERPLPQHMQDFHQGDFEAMKSRVLAAPSPHQNSQDFAKQTSKPQITTSAAKSVEGNNVPSPKSSLSSQDVPDPVKNIPMPPKFAAGSPPPVPGRSQTTQVAADADTTVQPSSKQPAGPKLLSVLGPSQTASLQQPSALTTVQTPRAGPPPPPVPKPSQPSQAVADPSKNIPMPPKFAAGSLPPVPGRSQTIQVAADADATGLPSPKSSSGLKPPPLPVPGRSLSSSPTAAAADASPVLAKPSAAPKPPPAPSRYVDPFQRKGPTNDRPDRMGGEFGGLGPGEWMPAAADTPQTPAKPEPMVAPKTPPKPVPTADAPAHNSAPDTHAKTMKGVGAAGIASRAAALQEGNMPLDEKIINGLAIAADTADVLSDTSVAKKLGVVGNLAGVAADAYKGAKEDGVQGLVREGTASTITAGAAVAVFSDQGAKIASKGPAMTGVANFAGKAALVSAAATTISDTKNYMTGKKEQTTDNVAGTALDTAVNLDPVKAVTSLANATKLVGVDTGIQNISIAGAVDQAMGGKGEHLSDIKNETQAIYAAERNRFQAGQVDSEHRALVVDDPNRPQMSDYRNLRAIKGRVAKHLPDGKIDGFDIVTQFDKIDFTKSDNYSAYRNAMNKEMIGQEQIKSENTSWVPRWARGGRSADKFNDAESELSILNAAEKEFGQFETRMLQYNRDNTVARQRQQNEPIAQINDLDRNGDKPVGFSNPDRNRDGKPGTKDMDALCKALANDPLASSLVENLKMSGVIFQGEQVGDVSSQGGPSAGRSQSKGLS